jgi:UPF0716 protein FxsA
MRILLLFLFLAYPMLELALLIKVGSSIGVWALMGIIVATGIGGALVLRNNGLAFLRNMSAAMAEGRPPLAPAFDSALVGLAGLLLIAPGLLTDVLGALLLVAPLRGMIVSTWSRMLTAGASATADPSATGDFQARTAANENDTDDAGPFGRPRRTRREPIIIEGEYERIDERDAGKPGEGPRRPPGT